MEPAQLHPQHRESIHRYGGEAAKFDGLPFSSVV